MAGKRKERRRVDGSSSSYPRKERRRRDGPSSSYPSSSAGTSTEETPATRSSDIHTMIEELTKKQAEGIKQKLEEQKEELKEEINKIHRQLNELSHIIQGTQLEQLNGSSGDGSPAPRSEPNQTQEPKFKLKIERTVEKGKSEKRKSITIEDPINVAMYPIKVVMYDGENPIREKREDGRPHPLASARVKMVVIDGKFNTRRNSWSKLDFKNSIKEPRHRQPTAGDENQQIESIVSHCEFNLEGGSKCLSDKATIWEHSANGTVKLGVMVLPDESYGEYKNERVLEGVSEESFLVRDRVSKKQKKAVEHSQSPSAEQAPVGCGQERNGPTLNRELQLQADPNMPSSSSTPRENTHGAHLQHCVEPSTNQQPSSFAGVQTGMLSDVVNHGMHSLNGGVQPSISDLANQRMHGSYGYSGQFFPVQLLWDRPGVEPSKRWNLLDQLMPLYSSQTKIHSGDFPTMRLMPEHYDSLTTYSQGPYQRLFFSEEALFLKKMTRDLPITTIPKEVIQTRRNRGVLIQPLEPDDSDDEPPLKRKLRNKYQLRFVNKVCEAYYTGEKIKADDGHLLNVALYDENNAKITSGPLSSASVEVVVLHGDFNTTGQDYWASEEFRSCVVCPHSTKEPPAIGGDRVLVLVEGEASLGDAFFQKSSINARTGKFKMGVMLASTPDERVQEGISEPFWVWNREEAAGQAQTMDEGTGPTYQLRFHGSLKARIYTKKPLLEQSNERIEIAIYQDGLLITSGHLSSVRVEIVALESNHTCKGSWTEEDFDRQIQMRRGGQGSVLEGDRSVKLVNGMASLGKVWFSEGSSGTQSRVFVLAARIDMSEKIEGLRVEEAFMQPAITVLVEPSEANEKSVLPMLNDKLNKQAYNELEGIDFQYVMKDNDPEKISANVNAAGSSSIPMSGASPRNTPDHHAHAVSQAVEKLGPSGIAPEPEPDLPLGGANCDAAAPSASEPSTPDHHCTHQNQGVAENSVPEEDATRPDTATTDVVSDTWLALFLEPTRIPYGPDSDPWVPREDQSLNFWPNHESFGPPPEDQSPGGGGN